MDQTVSLTSAGIARGATLSLTFSVSSVVYGIAFGLLASGKGLSSLDSILMSALVFSGSAQVAAVQAWSPNLSLIAVFATVLIANVRYVLMSAALRPWLAPLGPWKAALALLPLVDASFAVSFTERARGDHDAGVMLGFSLTSLVGWIVGTAIGVAAGALIANPRAFGLDFVIVAFCAASASMLARGRKDILPGIAALAAVLATEWLAPGPWTVIAAAAAAAVVAAASGPAREAAASEKEAS